MRRCTGTRDVTMCETIDIQSRILTIRGVQVMLDRDLAELYGVDVRRLNEQVTRNRERFPERFMHQLTKEEFADLKSQIATSSWGGVRKPPRVFAEQGISMLSAVLRSATAIAVSIRIMDAFVAMRRFIQSNVEVFQRIALVEKRQLTTDAKVEAILERLDNAEPPIQGVFYDGQLWDACSLVEKLVARAKMSILLIDNWVGAETLDMLAKKRKGVSVMVVTSEHKDRNGKPRPTLAATDIVKFNAQYPTLTVRYSEKFHGRFLILDDKEIYLIGASLKDLGKKCFAFTKLDSGEIAGLKARV